ncbi:MAG: hypothetical protein KC656_24320, partial [Myxococcales bacterium]|nr:hypothetical protein [Myxococcales bacterium]
TGKVVNAPPVRGWVLEPAPTLLGLLNPGVDARQGPQDEADWIVEAGLDATEADALFAKAAAELALDHPLSLPGFGSFSTRPGPQGRSLALRLTPAAKRALK